MAPLLTRAIVLLFLCLGIWNRPVQAQIDVSLPTLEGVVDSTLFVPVTVGSLTGEGVTSYQFTVSFDPSIVEVVGATVTGTMSEGIVPTLNTTTAGEMSVAWAAASALEGSGTLVNLEVNLLAEGTSALSFSAFIFNEGAPTANTSSGEITVSGPPQPDVSVSAPTNTVDGAVASFLIPIDVSDITGLGVSSYTFILNYDPSVINITGVDAVGTLSAGGAPIPNTGTPGQVIVSWATAVAPDGAGTLINLVATPIATGSSNLTFTFFQFNDGVPQASTENGSVTVEGSVASDTTQVSIGDNLTGEAGQSMSIPVQVDDVTDKNITSWSFTLNYDSALMTVTGASGAGSLSSTGTLSTFLPEPGKVTVTWSGSSPLAGEGTLVNLLADLATPGSSSLQFETASFNSGLPVAATNDGAIDIQPGQGPVTVSLPSPMGNLGEAIMIPVEISGHSPGGITSFVFTLSYDAEIIDITEVHREGTLTEGGDLAFSTSNPGEITVTWSDAAGLTGSGALVQVKAVLLAEGITALSFTDFQFNAGQPSANTGSGTVTVNEIDAPPVIGVSISKAVTGQLGVSLVVPVQVGTVSEQNITSYSFAIAYNPIVATVVSATLDGTLSSGGNLTVDDTEPGVFRVNWDSGAALDGSGTLINLVLNPEAEGTSALTFNDFEFNEGNPPASTDHGSITVSSSGETVVGVALPNGITGAVGDVVSIPLTVGALDGKDVTAYSFVLGYDASDLLITQVETAGTLSEGTAVSFDAAAPGQVTVDVSATSPLTGSGTLLKLQAQLIGPGTSALPFLSFSMNGGDQPAAAVGGSITVQGVATFLQFIHNSPDAPIVDVYVNDVRVIDALSYANATTFIEINTPVVKVDLVHDAATTNNSPITTSNLTLVNDAKYVGVINGLFGDTGVKKMDLVVDETASETGAAEQVDLQIFQGSPDAPALKVRLLDSSGAHREVAVLSNGLAFGQTSSNVSLPPDVYHVELVDPAGQQVGVFRADLSRTAGSSLLFIVQGFVTPGIGEPALTITGYAPDGRGLFLPSSVNTEDEASLAGAFALQGNFPNPFNPTTTIRLTLPEPAEVQVAVFDMLGREVLSVPPRQFLGGDHVAIPIDASGLASGTYLYRVLASGTTHQFAGSDTMTLTR